MQGPKHAYLASVLAFLSMLGFPLSVLAIGDGAARVRASFTDEGGQPYRECWMELLSIYNKRVFVYPMPEPPYREPPIDDPGDQDEDHERQAEDSRYHACSLAHGGPLIVRELLVSRRREG